MQSNRIGQAGTHLSHFSSVWRTLYAAQVLRLDAKMKMLAEKLKHENSLLVFGRGYNYATALEAALKVCNFSSQVLAATAFSYWIGNCALLCHCICGCH